MDEIAVLSARVRAAVGLPELLDAGFDAFETIRAAARGCEDRTTELFAAFMMAAGTATEGRNALNAAPSLPPGTSSPPNRNPPVSAATDVYGIADELADLAGLMARCLPQAAATATLSGDRAACQDAARAAAEIHQLLAGDSDETGPW
jgi:hypothetical protein